MILRLGNSLDKMEREKERGGGEGGGRGMREEGRESGKEWVGRGDGGKRG